MRGVVSVGMASAFEERGLLDCFDTIHGASAGACGGAYFAAGQAKYGMSVYYEEINNRDFIDKRRALWGKPIMDTSYLIDGVMRGKKPLRVERIIDAPGLLHIVATNANTGEDCDFNTYRDADHFFRILKATITLPLIAGPAVQVGDLSLLDGGVVQPIALKSALDAGASHVIVLMTHKEDDLFRRKRIRDYDYETLALRLVYGKRLADTYCQRNNKTNEIVHFSKKGLTDSGAFITAIARPTSSIDVHRLSIDGDSLQQACVDARIAAFNFVDGKS